MLGYENNGMHPPHHNQVCAKSGSRVGIVSLKSTMAQTSFPFGFGSLVQALVAGQFVAISCCMMLNVGGSFYQTPIDLVGSF